MFNGAAAGAGSYARVDESVFDANGIPGQNLLTTLAAAATPGDRRISVGLSRFHAGEATWKLPGEQGRGEVLRQRRDGCGERRSFVRQTFSQVVIPAPGTAALMGVGGLVAFRRRRA